jgi:hypothetical protein
MLGVAVLAALVNFVEALALYGFAKQVAARKLGANFAAHASLARKQNFLRADKSW